MKQTYCLKALSPIHIGDKEQTLGPMDYVIIGGRCWVISENKLCRLLASEGKIEEFERYIAKITAESRPQSERQPARHQKPHRRGDDKPKLTGFFVSQQLYNTKRVSELVRYSTACIYSPSENFRPLMRDAFDRPYIPGSSVKGVLRNAVSYKILKSIPEQDRLVYFQHALKRISDLHAERRLQRQHLQFLSQEILEDLWTSYVLPEAKKQGPNTDLFRIVKVADSSTLERDSAVVEEVKIFSVGSYESPKNWSFYLETIPAGAEFIFTLNVDEDLRREFQKNNERSKSGLSMSEILSYVTDPLACAKELAVDLTEFDREFVRDRFGISSVYAFDGDGPDIRVGGGGGLLSTTVDLLMPDKERRKLLDTINPEKERKGSPAPKSRRFVMKGQEAVTSLGWASLQRIS